mgnify:CR=1 FL=1
MEEGRTTFESQAKEENPDATESEINLLVTTMMTENGYIEEKGSDMSENRKRTFYMVTNAGKEYLNGLKKEYADFIDAVDKILSK